jgi:hypothetical protein
MADVDQSAHARAALEADKKRQEEARKKVKDDRAARDKASKEMSSSDVKPTPTQEECDLAASGVHVIEHEADGSEEQNVGGAQSKDSKPVAAPKGGYQTRANPTS